MSDFIVSLLSFAFLAQVLRITVPYALAALGGVMSERSGVINFALEGMLLTGAFTGAVAAYEVSQYTVGPYEINPIVAAMLAGALGGLVIGALYAFIAVTFKADQVVVCVAINLLVAHLTKYLLKLLYNSASNSPTIATNFQDNPLVNPVFYFAVGLAVLAYVVFWLSRWGLRLRAVGDHPEAAHTLGVSVNRVRWQGVVLSGVLAGLGGAWMALSSAGFVADMVNGRGYIALAAVIMGSWRPQWALAACLLFGFADALQIKLQTSGIGVPNTLTQTFPYLLTMIALAGFIGRSRPPAAIGQPYGEVSLRRIGRDTLRLGGLVPWLAAGFRKGVARAQSRSSRT